MIYCRLALSAAKPNSPPPNQQWSDGGAALGFAAFSADLRRNYFM